MRLLTVVLRHSMPPAVERALEPGKAGSPGLMETTSNSWPWAARVSRTHSRICQSLEEQSVKHVKIPNLICALPGQADSRILVTAHTDHVAVGDGTVDNWSGASMLPDLYESLRAAPRRHTVVFIGFTQAWTRSDCHPPPSGSAMPIRNWRRWLAACPAPPSFRFKSSTWISSVRATPSHSPGCISAASPFIR